MRVREEPIAADRTDSRYVERALVLSGVQGPLICVQTDPQGVCRAGILIVAGQPQTRVGAHRMFVELSRGLGRQGVASLRFDVGGWGDSPGEPLAFEQSAPDIVAAAKHLRDTLPPGTPIWAWGLCDGASAAVLALPAMRAAGVEPASICLVNPWVRTEASLGAAMIRTYYARRVLAPEFWRRLLTGQVPLRNLLGDPLRHLGRRFGLGRRAAEVKAAAPVTAAEATATDSLPAGASTSATSASQPEARASATASGPATPDLPTQMMSVLNGYRGDVYTVLAGADLTAGETEALMRADKRWRKRIDRNDRLLRVADADHTFSTAAHWQAVIDWIAERTPRR